MKHASSVRELRTALRRWFRFTAQEDAGTLPPAADVQILLTEITRLEREIGPAFACAVQRLEASDWFRTTDQCPYCGQRGVFHDAEHTEAAS